jgi:hypothetical protein
MPGIKTLPATSMTLALAGTVTLSEGPIGPIRAWHNEYSVFNGQSAGGVGLCAAHGQYLFSSEDPVAGERLDAAFNNGCLCSEAQLRVRDRFGIGMKNRSKSVPRVFCNVQRECGMQFSI